MSLEKLEGGSSYLWFIAVGLALYCVLLTAITGDIGFNGDDWWVLALPYWNNYTDSLVSLRTQVPETGGRALLDKPVRAFRLQQGGVPLVFPVAAGRLRVPYGGVP